MVNNYFFKIGSFNFILEEHKSKLGYGYPRIIVIWPDSSWTCIDLATKDIVDLSPMQFASKFKEKVTKLNSIDIIRLIAKENGFDWDEFEKMVFEMYTSVLDNDEQLWYTLINPEERN